MNQIDGSYVKFGACMNCLVPRPMPLTRRNVLVNQVITVTDLAISSVLTTFGE